MKKSVIQIVLCMSILSACSSPKPNVVVKDEKPAWGFQAGEELTVRGEVHVYPVKGFGILPAEMSISPGEKVKVQTVDAYYCQVLKNGKKGWLPCWYLIEGKPEHPIEITQPVEMIMKEPAYFYIQPEIVQPYSGKLPKGRVVQIKKTYRDWAAVEFIAYDRIYNGEKWMRKDVLAPFDAALSIEGYVRPNTRDLNNRETLVHNKGYIILKEYKDRYLISAPGGSEYFIRKQDFVRANPFQY